MSPQEILDIAKAHVEDAYNRFPIRSHPLVVVKPYRVSAGMAYYRRNVIGVSAYVLQTPEQVRETTLHEYAHLLAVHRHGERAANHGAAWKQAMQDLGIPPVVRHNLPVVRNARHVRVIYRCTKCKAEIVRSRRLNSRRKYLHVNCNGVIKLDRIENSDPA